MKTREELMEAFQVASAELYDHLYGEGIEKAAQKGQNGLRAAVFAAAYADTAFRCLCEDAAKQLQDATAEAVEEKYPKE